MKVAIMQPYFFPYLGYYSLIEATDSFILFDTPQFIRHGWIERNRLLNVNNEPFYIKVPLQKHSRDTTINNVLIRNENWQDKILAQLVHYKKRSKHYYQVISLVKECFNITTSDITDLNCHILKTTCDYLDITNDITIFSKLNLKIPVVNHPDEWALHISKAINANEYYNPPGGKSFFNKTKYDDNKISLHFLKQKLMSYKQFQNNFVAGLSILDVIMFNSAEETKTLIQQYEVE